MEPIFFHQEKRVIKIAREINADEEYTCMLLLFRLSAFSDFRLQTSETLYLRGAWRDRDTNDIFAHCSLIFYFLDFKFSNFVCPSDLHRLIWFF